MQVEFDDEDLDRLEVEVRYAGSFSQAIVKGFRKVMQTLRAANDVRDLYALRGLGFENLKGKRAHQYSARINKQWRLILELKDTQNGQVIRVVKIEDYH